MISFLEIRKLIKSKSENANFVQSSLELQELIFGMSKAELIPVITEIGVIPEDIKHDSSEEKLYAKVTDIIMAKCFQELGLKASVINQRSNCADVLAKSNYHNYSLVGDAKAFRLSRTAKNQKDFKVKCMVDWKCDNDYAILACPYFQYPKSNSQIFGQALSGNVLLFSWEHFSILLKSNVKESSVINLSKVWDMSRTISEKTSVSLQNISFLEEQNKELSLILGISDKEIENHFDGFKQNIKFRGETEIIYWKNKIEEIKQYSKEQAITSLIMSLNLYSKIDVIERYLKSFG